jgi:hypothetical protein
MKVGVGSLVRPELVDEHDQIVHVIRSMQIRRRICKAGRGKRRQAMVSIWRVCDGNDVV